MIAWHAHCTHTRKSNQLSNIYLHRDVCWLDSSNCSFKRFESVYTIQMKLDQLLTVLYEVKTLLDRPQQGTMPSICVSVHFCSSRLQCVSAPLAANTEACSHFFVAICHIATESKYNFHWIFMDWTVSDFLFQFLRFFFVSLTLRSLRAISSSTIIAVDVFIDYVYTERFVNLVKKEECNDSKHEGAAACIFHS